MERFHWEADPEEPVEGAPLGGEWTATYDDATGEVTTTQPEAEPVVRPYSAAELAERAARINALRALREAAHIAQVLDESKAELDAEMQEQAANLAAAQGQVAAVAAGLVSAQADADAAMAEAEKVRAEMQAALAGVEEGGTLSDAALADVRAKAEAAQAAAEAAQAAADEAAADLLALEGRGGRVIVSSQAPTGADRDAKNLWLAPATGVFHEWTGSAWRPVADERVTALAGRVDQTMTLAGAADAAADAAAADAEAAHTLAASASTSAEQAQAAALAARSEAESAAADAASALATATTAGTDAGKAIRDAKAAKDAADAAQAAALAAQAAADDAAGKATTASGRITVATANPATSDAIGKPEGAIWEVRSGTTVLRRFILVGGKWTQHKAGQDFIGDNAIGSAQIIDASIGTAEIADLAVTNAKIGGLDVAKLTASTAQMTLAAVEKIVGDAAFFKLLTADRLSITPGNLLPDPRMERKEAWNNSSYWSPTGGYTGGGSLTLPTGTVQRYVYAVIARPDLSAPIQPGNQYRVSVWFKPSQTITAADSLAIYCQWRNEAGTQVGTLDRSASNPAGSFAAGQWHQLSGTTGEAPAGATRLVFGLVSQSRYSGEVTFSDAAVQVMAGAVLIADGAITAPKITATADLWAKMVTVAGDATVGGNLIVDNTIDATKVRMDEAWANKIAANMAAFQEAFIGKLSALAIEASTFDGYTIRGAEIISPSETGEIRLTDNTLSVGRLTEDGLQTTVSLGGGTDDEFSLTPLGSAAPTVSMTGATGDAGFAGEVSVGSLTVDGRPLSEIIDPLPRGVIGMTWGSGSALPDIGQSEYGLVRFMGAVEAGRRYRFSADLKLQGTAGDTVEFLLRQSLDAGGATVNSGRLAAWRESIPTGGIGAATLSRTFSVTESSDSFSLLLSMRNWSANTRPVGLWADGGSDQSQSYFALEDIGAIRAGMGALWTGAGGTPYAGQTAPPPPPETKRTYTKTYAAAAVRSWRGSGTVTSELGHGTYGGYKRVSQILFPASVKADLTGATNIRARVKLRNTHTYYGAGMTAYVSPGTQTSLASSPATTPTGSTSHWSKGDAKYVRLPGFTGSHQSVWLGIGAPGGNGSYGKFSPALGDCVLELTYDK